MSHPHSCARGIIGFLLNRINVIPDLIVDLLAEEIADQVRNDNLELCKRYNITGMELLRCRIITTFSRMW